MENQVKELRRGTQIIWVVSTEHEHRNVKELEKEIESRREACEAMQLLTRQGSPGDLLAQQPMQPHTASQARATASFPQQTASPPVDRVQIFRAWTPLTEFLTLYRQFHSLMHIVGHLLWLLGSAARFTCTRVHVRVNARKCM